MADLPLLSIITPSLNRAEFIDDAIQSVLNQDYPNFEHIIMDGGSTDGTRDVLSQYSHLKIISRPDKGIYNAINSGIDLAKGEILGFLNTDDRYTPRVFNLVAEQFFMNSEIKAVSGASRLFSLNDQGIRNFLTTNSCIEPNNLLRRATLLESSFNSWFFRRETFHQIGVFRIKYLLLADRDFLIRFAFSQQPFASLDQILYYYRQHPGSLTLSGRNQAEELPGFEAQAIASDYLNSNTDLLPKDRKTLVEWHSTITSLQTIAALRRGAYDKASYYAHLGKSYDQSWLARFSFIFITNGLRYIRRTLELNLPVFKWLQ